MTADDDAFLRTIVDSPGRDLPRLVYADWLDDRNDPRGPFLRAEVEWAQPWKEGIRPGDATELRAMATGLDPLWVARVSRPPVGVCCDHITFSDSGSAVTESDLKDCETRLQVGFGIEVSAFLLNRNGGRPSPVYYLHPTKRDPYAVHWFLPATIATFNQPSIPQPHGGNIESYTPVLNSAGRGQEFLPFALDGEFHCIAIGLKARRAGKVYFFGSSSKLAADTLAEFLCWIGKPSWA